MTSRAVPVALAVLLLAEPVHGQSQTDAAKAEARAKVTEGGRLLDEGDAEGALRKFKEAYAAFDSPKIFFNFGLAHRRLAHDVEALEWFQRFLAEVPDAAPGVRAETQQYITELRARVASVEVACDVEGAEVSIDGQSRGVTPVGRPILVTAGPHQVVVQKPGTASPYTERIDAERGAVVRVNAHLRKARSRAAPSTTLMANGSEATRGEDRPQPTRWWLWAVIGGAVLAGAVAVGVAASSGGGPDIPKTDYGTMKF